MATHIASTCHVCLKPHKDPRTLSCHHSFCKKCLLDTLESTASSFRGIICPKCSEKDRLVRNEDDIDQLPKTVYMTNDVDTNSTEETEVVVSCEVCDTIPAERAVKRCTQCCVSYCNSCLIQLHPARGILVEHALVDPGLQDSTSPPTLEKDKQQNYCEDCNMIVTRVDVSGHHTHDLKSIKSAYKSRQAILKSHLTALADLKENTEIDYTMIGSTINNERENGFKAEEIVDALCWTLKNEIDRKRTTAVAEIREKVDLRIREKQSLLLELRDRLLQIESCLGYLQPLSAMTDKVLFLQTSKKLLTELHISLPQKIEIAADVTQEQNFQDIIKELRTALSTIEIREDAAENQVDDSSLHNQQQHGYINSAQNGYLASHGPSEYTLVLSPPVQNAVPVRPTTTYRIPQPRSYAHNVVPARPITTYSLSQPRSYAQNVVPSRPTSALQALSAPAAVYRKPQPSRNVGVARPIKKQIPQQQQARSRTPEQRPITGFTLATMEPQEQKQTLGESLYPLIQLIYPDLAGKITGMLLELDNLELLHMLECNESLEAKVEEAVAVLQAHQVKEAAETARAANVSSAGKRGC